MDSGDVASAFPALMELREQALKENDERRSARVAMMLSAMYEDCGGNESALTLAREAAAKYEELGDSVELTEVRLRIASMTDESEGCRLLMQLLESDSVPEVTRLVALRGLAYSYYKNGEIARATEIYRGIIAAGKDFSEDWAYLGMLLLAGGRVEGSIGASAATRRPSRR